LSRTGREQPRTGRAADLLAVGLGNPGPEYAGHRHNLGADVVAQLAERHHVRLKPARSLRSLVAEVSFGGRWLALAFPQTFMNESGAAVVALVRRYGVADLSRLVVVHDELDLPVGRVKVKVGGGTAGHRGLRSVQDHLHSQDFVRVRVGIGRPPGRQQATDYVLRAPPAAERRELAVAVEEAADAVLAILAEGPDATMNRFNAGGQEPGE
jgi:peptidyl-tRNA hydrolase, PTH1 family